MADYKAKGDFIFVYSEDDGLINFYRDYNEVDIALGMNMFPIYDLIDGKDFLKYVEESSFIDYDGVISDIFIDGYHSNLGLKYKGICQGKFLMSGEEFRKVCNEYKVEVNWANK